MDDNSDIADVAMPSVKSGDRSVDQKSRSTSTSVLSGDSTMMLKDTNELEELSIVRTIELSTSMSDSGVTSDISSEGDKTIVRATTRVPSPVRAVNHSYPRSFPTDIKIVQVGERSWMCDICKVAVFGNFVEACMHEMVCKPPSVNVAVKVPPPLPVQYARSDPLAVIGPHTSALEESSRPMKQRPSGKPLPISMSSVKKPIPTSMTTRPKTKPTKTKTQASLDVSLVPENRAMLSDYNYILTQNIEFFEVSTSYSIASNPPGMNMSDLPKSKVGLRCIHCFSNERHVTAASFFPSSTASISSGMGTIGSRHFIGGKCPCLPKEILEKLAAAKKVSQQQTRTQGKLGLDAYCKKLAKSQKIFDHEVGGIFIAKKSSSEEEASPTDTKMLTKLPKKDSNAVSTVVVRTKEPVNKETTPKDVIADRNDPFAFKESALEHFWDCGHCNSLPFQWRASGSVVFCATTPTIELVGKHLSVCQGKKPLRIPRNASIKIRNSDHDDNSCSVLVQWNNDDGLRKSGRIKRQSLGPENAKKKKKAALTSSEPLKQGVEDESLTFQSDKSLTTDFAHFTVLQLKKCYLTKAGGSRGNCPIGYPGLACTHCAGNANERRFFYTSADHLRNSFSHIPSHLVMCSKCPPEVKAKIEEYKLVRNKQKSQLKIGNHKVFIDRVWERLHGPGGGVIEIPEANNAVEDMSDDDRSHDRGNDSVSVDFLCNPSDDYLNESLDGRYLECKEIAIETSASTILSSSDKRLASNYVYYALLQMVPKQYSADSEGNVSDLKEVEEKDVQNEARADKVEDSLDVNMEETPKVEETAKVAVKVEDSLEANMEDPSKIVETAKVAVKVEDTLDANMKDTSKTDAEKCCVHSEGTKASNDNVKATQEPEEKNEIFDTLVCKHCMNEDMQSEFLPSSGEELRASFAEIPKHFMSCSKCPSSVKSKLETLKALRPIQEAILKRGANNKLMNSVWNRLESHFADPKMETSETQNISDTFSSDVLEASLLSAKDRTLVSEFTFYTMEQMEPCVLQNSGNGSRSMFAYGFPGLGCKHCSDKPSARKFFYRTSEILSGNYAHIPNHVLSCKFCPLEVKQTLAAKKRIHQAQKQILRRGSQRIFFNNVWDR